MMAGVNLTAVHYRSSIFPDLLGGQVQVTFSPIPSSLDFIRAGKLRALAVTTATRAKALPDVPTVGEFVKGYQATAWSGIGVPANTPAEIVNRLNQERNRLPALYPDTQARVAPVRAMFCTDDVR